MQNQLVIAWFQRYVGPSDASVVKRPDHADGERSKKVRIKNDESLETEVCTDGDAVGAASTANVNGVHGRVATPPSTFHPGVECASESGVAVSSDARRSGTTTPELRVMPTSPDIPPAAVPETATLEDASKDWTELENVASKPKINTAPGEEESGSVPPSPPGTPRSRRRITSIRIIPDLTRPVEPCVSDGLASDSNPWSSPLDPAALTCAAEDLAATTAADTNGVRKMRSSTIGVGGRQTPPAEALADNSGKDEVPLPTDSAPGESMAEPPEDAEHVSWHSTAHETRDMLDEVQHPAE